MEFIIVTLKKEEDANELDLEVPRQMRLVQELALALGWSGDYRVFANPPARLLAPHETLAQAGVWDGARLILTRGGYIPVESMVSVTTPAPTPPPGGPLGGWRPLDLGNQPPLASPPPSSPSSGGFNWKRIDDD